MSVLTYYPKNFRANGWGWHRGGNAAAAVSGFLKGERGQGSSEPLLGHGSLYPSLPTEDDTVFNAGISKLYPQLPAEEYESGAVEEVVEESCASVNFFI
ncbi:Acetylglucosamine-6-sulfatase [Operophtera brumata]|uniref:Acetylglucosamine-6-sulfatase n=1 Tax=Operophtera brumata TaxID=104452 RepID=A0A0L7KVM7_OPEBR|nr:Acetylglucosamine-6-sulfatase [Operophtera brumata]